MITLKNITKTYQMGTEIVHALDKVSLEIKKGDYLAIMGQSGSGKSTMLNILGCLMKPGSGTYLFKDKSIDSYTQNQLALIRKESIGFVFQSYNLLSYLSVFENIRLPLIYQRRPVEEQMEKVEGVMDALGLAQRKNHHPEELSGGQRQRVAIARALISDPDILIADEPTGNLDSKTEREIFAIFEKLNTEGKTVVVVTHNPMVAAYSKRIIMLQDGVKTADFDYSEFRQQVETD